MQLIAYLNYDGDCAEAFDFYARALGGEVKGRFTYGQSPMAGDMPASSHGRVMHSELHLGGRAAVMGADGPPTQGAPGEGTCVNVMADTAEEAERAWAGLKDGARIGMELQETFWAHRFGMLVDRYGKPWMVNCVKEMDA